MSDIPAVSVVIPLYNKSPYIARALNSVLAQTFQDFEVIVVDDGSTDNGAEVVRGFRDRRVQLIQQENQGVSAARNRGIEASRAELVAFLDADDEWMSEHLEVLLRLRRKYPEAGAYGTAYLIQSKSLRTRIAPFSKYIPKKPWEGLLPNYFKASTYGTPPISSSTVAIPQYILNEIGGFNINHWRGEDLDFWGRIAIKYPIAFSWKGLGVIHHEAVNRASNRITNLEESLFIYTVNKAQNEGKIPSLIQKDLLEYVARLQIELIWHSVRAKRIDRVNFVFKRCVEACFNNRFSLFALFCARLFIRLSLLKLKILVKKRSIF
jgi:glycosyltransferase involved in cell wall biosynthesis